MKSARSFQQFLKIESRRFFLFVTFLSHLNLCLLSSHICSSNSMP
uniref:Uncharacterized protein n=1 Tax=Rhizophora mucronata TaxID=61149 RepID=A0A2P2NS02_RHIMU